MIARFVLNSLKALRNTVCEFRAKQLCHDQVFEVSMLGAFNFHASNPTEYFRTVKYGGEPESLACFLALLKQDDIVWDIGASIGLYTVHAAERVKAVVSFEPDPAIASRLRQNVAANGFTERVEVQQAALGQESGTLQLFSDGVNGNSPSIRSLGRHEATVEVDVTTIDDLVDGGRTAVPTVLKIDIEGAEHEALLGAQKLFSSSCRPRLVFVELHPKFLPEFGSSPSDVLKLLGDSGMVCISHSSRDNEEHAIFVSLESTNRPFAASLVHD